MNTPYRIYYAPTPLFYRASIRGVEPVTVDMSDYIEEIYYTKDCDRLVHEIDRQARELAKAGYEPEYIVMGVSQYKQLAAYLFHTTEKHDMPNEYLGLPIIVTNAYVLEVVAKPTSQINYLFNRERGNLNV